MPDTLTSRWRRSASYEWWRLRTLPSTWTLLSAAILVSAAVTYFVALAARQGALSGQRGIVGTALSQGGSVGIPFFAAHLCAFAGALGWAEDARGDAATTTLTTITGRARVFLGRTTAAVLVATLGAMLSCAVVVAVLGLDLGWSMVLDEPRHVLVQTLRTVVYFVFLTLVYANATVILRSPALAVFAVLGLQFLAEPLLQGVVLLVPSLTRFVGVLRYLPFTAADSLRATPVPGNGFSLLGRLGTTTATAESAVIVLTLTAAAVACFRFREP